jgi:metal-dependent hydrolase (beta-lactamase superfamily II)
MIISILKDNNPGENTTAKYGVSYLVEYEKKRLFFDTGQSKLFLNENFGKKQVRPEEIFIFYKYTSWLKYLF